MKVPRREHLAEFKKSLERTYNQKLVLLAKQYFVDFDERAAAKRSRISLEEASIIMDDPRFMMQLQEYIETVDQDDIITRNEILAALKKEAFSMRADSTSASRITALRELAKLLGMELPSKSELQIAGTPVINLTLNGTQSSITPKAN